MLPGSEDSLEPVCVLILRVQYGDRILFERQTSRSKARTDLFVVWSSDHATRYSRST